MSIRKQWWQMTGDQAPAAPSTTRDRQPSTRQTSMPLAHAEPVKREEVSRPAGRSTPYLNTNEAAEVLRLSGRSLERFRLTGQGPRYLKVGPGKRARVLYRYEDLIEWLEGQSYASTSEYDGQ